MRRVGGPGGPQVPPQSPAGPGPERTDFASKVAQAQVAQAPAQTEAPKAPAKPQQSSQLVAKTREIARDLLAKKISEKEATRALVSLVIEERHPYLKKKKKRHKKGSGDDNDKDQNKGEDDENSAEERLEEAVTELIDRDPALAKRLKTAFTKLAATKG